MPYIRTISVDPRLVNTYTCYHAGLQGEDGATLIDIDLSEWLAIWTTGVATAAFERPDGNAYSVTLAMAGDDNDHAQWSPAAVDTEIAGKAYLEITLTDTGSVVKTVTIPLYIGPDIGAYVPESSIASGDIPFSGVAGTEYLNIGTAGQVLAVNVGATAPEWKSFGAADVPIADSAEIFTATNVETALAEVRTAVDALEADVDAGTVSLTDAGAYYTTDTAEAALQELGPQLTHVHGNITNNGKIGSTSGLVVVTSTGGEVDALAAGTTSEYLRGDGTWQEPSGSSNRNLLHNWDMLIPINQRRGTTYAGSAGSNVYTIDRWCLGTSDAISVSAITENVGVTITNDGSGGEIDDECQIIQFLADYARFKSMTLTATVNVVSLTGAGSAIIAINDGVDSSTESITGAGVFTVTHTVNASATYIAVVLKIIAASSTALTFSAVKLELGSASTLSLDPPADRAEQYAICRRFYEALYSGVGYTPFGAGIHGDTSALVHIQFTHKRTTPTITFTGSFLLYATHTGTGEPTYLSKTPVAANIGVSSAAITLGSLTDMAGDAAVLCTAADATGVIHISADL